MRINKRIYSIVNKTLPFLMIFFFYSFLLVIGYEDIGSSRFFVDRRLFIVFSLFLLIATVSAFYNTHLSQMVLKKSENSKDNNEYVKNHKKRKLNAVLFGFLLIVLIIFAFLKDKVRYNTNYNHFDFYTHNQFIYSLIMLFLIRCYYGYLLFSEKIIAFSQNMLRLFFIILGIVVPYTRYSYVSFSSVINAVVASVVFDTLLNNFFELYILKNENEQGKFGKDGTNRL